MTPAQTAIAIAATHADWGALPWGWGTLAGFGTVIVYAVACWWRPFAYCRKCEGKGRFSSRNGKTFRDCPRCKGSGRRLRFGRHVYNYLANR